MRTKTSTGLGTMLGLAVLLALAMPLPLTGAQPGAADRPNAPAPNGMVPASMVSTPVLLIHGIGKWPDQMDGACNGEKIWQGVEQFLAARGWTQVKSLGYYVKDDCNDSLYDYEKSHQHCIGSRHDLPSNDGTWNEDDRHVACELAWYIWDNFTRNGIAVNVVAHSLGGVLVKEALYLIYRNHDGTTPPPYLYIKQVVTFDSPLTGLPLGADIPKCGLAGCLQLVQIEHGADVSASILSHLDAGKDVQATDGTNWTMIGDSDKNCNTLGFAVGDSAFGMSYGVKISYNAAVPQIIGMQDACGPDRDGNYHYGHGTYLFDAATASNVRAQYCTGCSTELVCSSCFGNHGSTVTVSHSLQEMAWALNGQLTKATVAINSTNTFVVIGRTVYKYDLGGLGANMYSTNTSGIGGPHYIGNEVFSSPITAIAVNSQYLFVALGNRLVKTTLCGGGEGMCALSDGSGSASLPGYHYLIGYQDYSVPVTGVAATNTYLYTNLAGGGVRRTVKTTLCDGGANMCALSDGIGSGSLPGWSLWIGQQDWSWNPSAIAANDSFVFTVIGSDRVCKTTPGSSGSSVFATSDGTCTGAYPGYHYWIGYQDWSHPITNLAIDGSNVWWSLGDTGRLVKTTMCGGGGNVCALADGFGTGGLAGYPYWVGRQDWCSGFNQMAAASLNGRVASIFTGNDGAHGYTRVVQAIGDSGFNMFAVAPCDGSGRMSSYPWWIGYQDFGVTS
jgi:hypothetical protein